MRGGWNVDRVANRPHPAPPVTYGHVRVVHGPGTLGHGMTLKSYCWVNLGQLWLWWTPVTPHHLTICLSDTVCLF